GLPSAILASLISIALVVLIFSTISRGIISISISALLRIFLVLLNLHLLGGICLLFAHLHLIRILLQRLLVIFLFGINCIHICSNRCVVATDEAWRVVHHIGRSRRLRR